jgi:uncharacterized protein YceK
MNSRIGGVALMISLAVSGCTSIKEADKAREEASTKGKYAVRLTEDAEKVQGTCKFVKNLDPQYDPIQIPAPSQVPDWLRTEAVLAGADTVLVRGGKFGEAYICGPGPLSPDGTLKAGYAPPVAPARPTPTPR